MDQDTINKGKYFTLLFWMVALAVWVIGWTGGLGGLVLAIAKLLVVAHTAELFIFSDTIESSEEDTVEERIKVFVYGYFRVKELQNAAKNND